MIIKKIKKLKYLTEDIDKVVEEGRRIEGLSYGHYHLLKSMNPIVDKINEIIDNIND